MTPAPESPHEEALSIEDRLSLTDWVELEPTPYFNFEMCEEIANAELAHAESLKFENSPDLDTLLTSQMVTAHRLIVKLMKKADTAAEDATSYPDTLDRLINQSTRLMKVFQQGLETLSKVRRNGTQTVNVQHIHLADDSKAIVAGMVDCSKGSL